MENIAGRYGASAAWFDPKRPPEAYMDGLAAVVRELGAADAQIRAAGWSLDAGDEITPEALTEQIETTPVKSAYNPDGSPRLSTGFLIDSPHPDRRKNLFDTIGLFSFERATDLPAQQTISFVLQHITFSTAVTLVRSIARHLQPDVIGADTREFGRALRRAQTVNIRATQLVGQISWIRGLSPEAVAGYPVTNVEEYAGGLFFLARSEQDAAALAGLNDQLERDHTRRRLGLLPQFYDRDEV